jgi:DNA-binding Lrp family transcriptional regulator
MVGSKVDKDRKILEILVRNARTSFSDIAKAVELSVTACKARIKRLERDGIIERYTILVNPSRAARHPKYILLELDSTNDETKRAVVAFCKSRGDVVSLELVEGNYDFLLQLHEYSPDQHDNFLSALGRVESIKRTTTISVINKFHLEPFSASKTNV